MEAYAKGQIKSGAYANLSEVVRAGIRMLMERDGARQFYALKADLEHAVHEAETGLLTTSIHGPTSRMPTGHSVISALGTGE